MTFWSSSREWTLEVTALCCLGGTSKRVERRKLRIVGVVSLSKALCDYLCMQEPTLALQPSTTVSGQPQFCKLYFLLFVTWGKSLCITLLSASVRPLQENKPGHEKQRLSANQSTHEDSSLGSESSVPRGHFEHILCSGPLLGLLRRIFFRSTPWFLLQCPTELQQHHFSHENI